MFWMTQRLLKRSMTCPGENNPPESHAAHGKRSRTATSMDTDSDCNRDLQAMDIFTSKNMDDEGGSLSCDEDQLAYPYFNWSAGTVPQLTTQYSTSTKFDQEPCRVAGLAFSACGQQLAVADRANHKVKVFSLSGQLCVECTVNKAYGSLDTPSAVSFTASNHILVADQGKGDVKVFTQDGQYLLSFGRNLSQPRALYVMKDDSIVVVDAHEVYIYRTFSDKWVRRLTDVPGLSERLASRPLICATTNYIVLCITTPSSCNSCSSSSTKTVPSVLVVLSSNGQVVREVILRHSSSPESLPNANLPVLCPTVLYTGQEDTVLFSTSIEQLTELWTVDLSQEMAHCNKVNMGTTVMDIHRAVLGKPALLATTVTETDMVHMFSQ